MEAGFEPRQSGFGAVLSVMWLAPTHLLATFSAPNIRHPAPPTPGGGRQSSADWLCSWGAPDLPRGLQLAHWLGKGSWLSLLTEQLFPGPKAPVVGNYNPSSWLQARGFETLLIAHVSH